MESFVIRIYRRSDAGQPVTIGTLESIATGKRSAFHSQAELMAMLEESAGQKTRSNFRRTRKSSPGGAT
ncbi:MAG: hypothetical protein ABI583_07395 [Betaproteobacteria bacterium]